MEFVGGLLLGALLGVFADRLWEKWEKRTRVSIQSGFFASCIGEGSGLTLTITNNGMKDIPDYEVQLFHPARGSMSAFLTPAIGPLLSGQQREYRCPLLDRDLNRPFFRNWFFHENDRVVTEFKFDDFRFRLKMKNSNVFLFESRDVGIALAKLWANVLLNGDLGSMTGEALFAIRCPKPSRWRRWRNARRDVRHARLTAHEHIPDRAARSG